MDGVKEIKREKIVLKLKKIKQKEERMGIKIMVAVVKTSKSS